MGTPKWLLVQFSPWPKLSLTPLGLTWRARSAMFRQTRATSLVKVGKRCWQCSMVQLSAPSWTLSHKTVTALSSTFSTSPKRMGTRSTAAPAQSRQRVVFKGNIQYMLCSPNIIVAGLSRLNLSSMYFYFVMKKKLADPLICGWKTEHTWAVSENLPLTL